MFEEGLYSLVSSDPGVRAQLGGSPFARTDSQSGLFAVQLPEEASRPALVYEGIGSQDVTSTQGTNRLGMRRVQFKSHGRSYADSQRLKQAVKDCLLGFIGDLNDGSQITSVVKNLELDAFEAGPFDFVSILDFNIWCVEV